MEAQKEHSILVIEDNPSVNKLLEIFLFAEGYSVYKAYNGKEGLELFYKYLPDLVLSDIHMPNISGIELCAEIKSREEFRLIPVILLTAAKDIEKNISGIEAGADDFITKPVNRVLLSARIKRLLQTKMMNEKLDNSWSMLYSLAKIIEARDSYTEKHTIRVARLAQSLGAELGLPGEKLDILAQGGVLHDIGKVGIRDNILCKPGPLTKEEFDIMKTHTQIGYEICRGLKSLKDVADIIYSHHEKYDGSGYPQGLAKDEIPLLAHIISITDVYDALTSDRSYRKKLSFEEAARIIINEKGKSFEPDMVDIFINKVIE
ncbi:MAG TPA: response regulator [Calditrichaeota bacterium]|nr:response regulator [Calditrichota bacterium]